VILVFVLGAPWQVTAAGLGGVPRFQQVGPNFYRGGQPTEKGFQELQEFGIRTVINLRVDDSERKIIESLGMTYVHIPISMPSLTRPWKKVSEADLAAFFAALEAFADQPVFVHCHRGADRTGVMVGLYRIIHDHWDGASAYDEARRNGMRWWLQGFKKQLLP
jgi:protein tyrosine/serine phosphatase